MDPPIQTENFPLRRSHNLDLHGGGGQSGHLLLHPVSNAGVHGGAAGQDSVGVQVLPDVHITLHDGVVGGLVDASRLHVAHHVGLEESLGTAESLVTDLDHLAVRKLVGLLDGAGGLGGFHLLLEVQGDVAKLLFDVPDDLQLGGGGEGVLSTLSHQLLEVVGEVSAGQVQSEDGVGEGVAFIDGTSVGDTVTGVHHDTGGTAGGVQGEHGLDGDVHGGGA